MDEFELKALIANKIYNGLVVVSCCILVFGMFEISSSWHSLWGFLGLFAVAGIKTGKAAEGE